MATPDKSLIMPVSRTTIGFDSDRPRLGGTDRPAPPYHTAFNLYDPLARPTIVTLPNGEKKPDFANMIGRLAESWTSTENDSVWTVKLRPAQSHFGNTLTAEDVVWSWQRTYAIRGVGLWRSRIAGGLPNADGIEALDDRTVRFTLSAPNPHWAKYWAFATNSIFDSVEAKKHADANEPWALDFLQDNPAGFGAFRLDHQDEQELRFAAREDYWDAKPGLDFVIQRRVDSRAEAVKRFKDGEFNLLAGLYPQEFNEVKDLPGVLAVISHTNHTTIELDWKTAPLDNPKLRQAFALALPYDRLLKEVYLGLVRPSRSPIIDVSNDYDDSRWPWTTNLEEARKLVAEAGATGVEIPFYIESDYESQGVGKIVKEALGSIGVTIHLLPLSEAPAGMVPMWFKSECSHGITDAHYDIAHDYDPPRGMYGNRFVRDSDMVHELRSINSVANPADRSKAYRDYAQKLVELVPTLYIANQSMLTVIRENVDPWTFSGKYQPWENLVWAAGKSVLPRS